MSIQKRTVYFDYNDGVAKFWDWAHVITTLGTMAEPFLPNAHHSLGQAYEDFDPEDEIARVDELRAMPRDIEQLVLSGGSDHLHGGQLLPRTGR